MSAAQPVTGFFTRIRNWKKSKTKIHISSKPKTISKKAKTHTCNSWNIFDKCCYIEKLLHTIHKQNASVMYINTLSNCKKGNKCNKTTNYLQLSWKKAILFQYFVSWNLEEAKWRLMFKIGKHSTSKSVQCMDTNAYSYTSNIRCLNISSIVMKTANIYEKWYHTNIHSCVNCQMDRSKSGSNLRISTEYLYKSSCSDLIELNCWKFSFPEKIILK